MKVFKILLMLTLCVILPSCAGVSQMQDKLAKATDKTASIAEMNFKPISASVEQPILFNEQTPFFIFEKGKSFYSAISLPEPRQPRFLNVKAYLTGVYLPSAAILIPNFLLLDADKKIIGKIENYRLKSVSDFWKGSYYTSQLVLPANTFTLWLMRHQSKRLKPKFIQKTVLSMCCHFHLQVNLSLA